VTRALLTFAIACSAFGQPSSQQSTKPPDKQEKQDTKPGKVVEEPPEEDEALLPKTCVLNPLEAGRDITVGNEYFKKGNYFAAANRFRDAVCWDPGSTEAYLRLGEVSEKLHNIESEREAYTKYVSLASDAKNLPDIKKKLAKLPPPKNK
jgi:hypothetical protein